MDSDALTAIRRLITTERVLSAAVLVDGEPLAALLPYAPADDLASLYVQASGLARHSRGLVPSATISILIHAPANGDRDPMQLPRLTVQAVVTRLERGSTHFGTAADRFTSRFPAASTTLSLSDFNLYALALGRGRYVEGFARAFNVGSDIFRTLTP